MPTSVELKRLLIAFIAIIGIITNIVIIGLQNRSILLNFLLGYYPYLVIISPFIGFLLSLLDVRFSLFVLNHIDPVRLELDLSAIEQYTRLYLSEKYTVTILCLVIYAIAEELIRGGFLLAIKVYSNLSFLPMLIVGSIVGTIILFIARAHLPIYLRAVKLVDDFILTLLLLLGGVLSAIIAHIVLNIFIVKPLLKSGSSI